MYSSDAFPNHVAAVIHFAQQPVEDNPECLYHRIDEELALTRGLYPVRPLQQETNSPLNQTCIMTQTFYTKGKNVPKSKCLSHECGAMYVITLHF